MSLQTRLSALISAIRSDFDALDTRVTAVEAGGGGGGGGVTRQKFQVTDDGTTGQTTTGSFVVLSGMWATPSHDDAAFTWNGTTGELEINEDGEVEFDIQVMSHQSTGNNRTQIEIQIYKNNSTVLVQSYNYSQRNSTQDKGGAHINGFSDNAVDGDVYEIRVRDIGTAVNVGSSDVPGDTFIAVTHWS
jgi:hypothetical protein